MSSLNAISPIDGRYRKQVDMLGGNFSEAALIRYRVRVEIEYFIALCELPLPQLSNFDKGLYPKLREIYENFTVFVLSRHYRRQAESLLVSLDSLNASVFCCFQK